ncbi:hypothetical protein [Kitasatospora sp. NPDC088783]|uniref:hypothetical protein n=1 Tax=Kitasatospora sp. NPDC088783 TaxID=3364077 RepID=UPI00382EC262
MLVIPSHETVHRNDVHEQRRRTYTVDPEHHQLPLTGSAVLSVRTVTAIDRRLDASDPWVLQRVEFTGSVFDVTSDPEFPTPVTRFMNASEGALPSRAPQWAASYADPSSKPVQSPWQVVREVNDLHAQVAEACDGDGLNGGDLVEIVEAFFLRLGIPLPEPRDEDEGEECD